MTLLQWKHLQLLFVSILSFNLADGLVPNQNISPLQLLQKLTCVNEEHLTPGVSVETYRIDIRPLLSFLHRVPPPLHPRPKVSSPTMQKRGVHHYILN